MSKVKYTALALDLDGTLTNDEKIIPQENKEAIWKAIDNGVTIILASGRPTMGITPVAKELELDKRGGIIIAFNGGKIMDCKTGAQISSVDLPAELVPAICEAAAKQGVSSVCYTDAEVVSEDDNEYVRRECKCTASPLLTVENLPEFLNYPVNKLLVTGEHEKLVKVREELLEKYSDKMTAFFSESYFLETAPLGVGKDNALDDVCKHLGITKDDLMVCGDGMNDVPMFDYAGFSVAMKNAYPEAASHADVTVPKTNNECGVAYAVEKYIFGADI